MSSKEQRVEKMIQFSQQASLFVVLIGLFLGSLYAFGGNLFIAVPLSVVLVGLMYFFVQHMVGAKMEKKRSGLSIGNKALWGLYILTSIPITILIMHMVNVEMIEKETIQEQGLQKIEKLRELKLDYTKNYENYLTIKRSNMISDLKDYSLGILSKAQLIDRHNVNEMFIKGCDNFDPTFCVDQFIKVHRFKFSKADTSIFGETEKYLNKQHLIIKGWDRFKVNQSLSDLDEYLTITHNELNNYLITNAEGKTLKAIDENTIKPTLIEHPIELFRKNIGIVLILVIILLHALLLLPYIIAPSRGYNKKLKSKPTSGVTRR